MGTQRSSFEKRERDRAKKAKAAAKQAKRQGRDLEPTLGDSPDEAPEIVEAPAEEVPTDDVLEALAELHRRYDAEQIGFDDFEEQKAKLLSQLTID